MPLISLACYLYLLTLRGSLISVYTCTFITFVLKAQSLIKVAEGGAN